GHRWTPLCPDDTCSKTRVKTISYNMNKRKETTGI
ncbi:hypothetical protein NPIL_232591, partial [Nephila pilipes]